LTRSPGRARAKAAGRSIPWSTLAACALACATLACAGTPRLRPAPAARAVPGPGTGAAETVAEVRVEVRSEAWAWHPGDLEQVVTPLLVRIRNEGERPLRVRYSELQLLTPGGEVRHAIPPFDIEAEVTEPLARPAYRLHGFHLAPHLGHHFVHGGGLHVGTHFAHHPGYYHTYYPVWREVDLPTEDMLVRALPEGTVESGGSAAGFVYFEPVEDVQEGEVIFRFELVDARSERAFDAARIPFEVEPAGWGPFFSGGGSGVDGAAER